MSKICTYDEGYDIYDAAEIGWCATCTCDPSCPMKRGNKRCPSCSESIKTEKNQKKIKFCPYCGSKLK